VEFGGYSIKVCYQGENSLQDLHQTVSVIIVNYNSGGLLCGCVASALHQAGEIIIIDNASTDSSINDLHADTFNPVTNILAIPSVQVRLANYSNVYVNFGTDYQVIAVQASSASNSPVSTIDNYDAVNNLLTIPLVRVDSKNYQNVGVKLGSTFQVSSVGNCTGTGSTVPTPANVASLIVDNGPISLVNPGKFVGSTDVAFTTVTIRQSGAKNCQNLVVSTWPHIRVINNSQNLGFAAACNIGVKAATGKYLLFLNPDCILATDAVQRMLEAIDSIDSVGMVGGLLVDPDGMEQGGSRRAIPTPWRSLVRVTGLSHFADNCPQLFYDFYLHKEPLPSGPIEVEAISGACMLVSRSAMDKIGQWDEIYFLHCEDLDLCMRFRLMGLKILFAPDAKIVHEKGGCSKNRPIFVEWHKHKGMMLFYRKFFRDQYPSVLMWLVGLGVWLRFGAIVAYYTVKRVGRVLEVRRG
jgi:GT2 family glycosyltransferase